MLVTKLPVDTSKITKADLDIFSAAGRIPVFSIQDVIDFVNYLTNLLGKQGLLPEHEIFTDGFEAFVESKMHLVGIVQVRAYTFYDNPSLIILKD